MVVLLLFVFVGPLVGTVLGSIRRHAVAGFFLGLCLGPLGWLIALLLPRPSLRVEARAGEWGDEYWARQYNRRPDAWRPPLPPGGPPFQRSPGPRKPAPPDPPGR